MTSLTRPILILALLVMTAHPVSSQEITPLKTVASSVENNDQSLAAFKATDNDINTRWSSAFSDPQWIYLDFGKHVKFNIVRLMWETAYAKAYEIQSSDDAIEWNTLFKESDGYGAEVVIPVGIQTARYVRMFGTKRGTGWGYSLYEFKADFVDDGKVPASARNLSAISGEGVIFLDWDDNSEIDIYGYNVYRCQKPQGPYDKINTRVITRSKYRDKDIEPKKDYRYFVRAVDYLGNEGLPSAKVLAVPISEKARNFLAIPSCAWTRYIGDIPDKCASSSPDRGVALGGFGAGSFMYSTSGMFGPWAMDIGEYDERWLPQAAFHIYEKAAGKKAEAKCLSAGAVMKTWNRLKLGEAKYYALQPKGWTTYDCFSADISSEFFSPIIANNYKETSYPVAVWKWKFFNPTDKKMELSLMLTWPQPPFGNKVRKGYKNIFLKKGRYSGIILKASDAENAPEAQNTEWCLATLSDPNITVSYAMSWNKDADGADIWKDFRDDGRLGNRRLDNSDSAAALAVKFSLGPKQERIVPIVLSWDFPIVEFGSEPGKGTQWWKKYTQYFGREGGRSFDIAKAALDNYEDWQKGIDSWMRPVIESAAYPEWLKCAAFNELYYSQFGGIFYEGGLKSGHPTEYMGKHIEDSKYFEMECITYHYCNTFDVRHYSSIIYARLWPQIEKELLVSWADAVIYYDPEHQTPHDAGNPNEDPYFKWDNYGTNKLRWKDLSSKFIQQVWRYYYLYKDREFLDYVWPACKATYEYMKATDSDGDYLPNNKGSDNTYDSFGFYGTSLLCGGLWVGALEAMEKMAEVQNDTLLAEVQLWLKNAKKNLDSQLWLPQAGYYKMDTQGKHSFGIMSDGLNGQRYCESFGLEDILPKEKMKSHYLKVYERGVVPLKDFNGDNVGDVGAINAINPDGSYLNLGQSDEIWTGSTYYLAAQMYKAGLKEEALKTAFGVYYITFKEESTAYWFNTPEAWRDFGLSPRPTKPEQYQRPRAVWELLFEIEDPYIPK